MSKLLHYKTAEEAEAAGIDNPQLVWCRGHYCFRDWSLSPVEECLRRLSPRTQRLGALAEGVLQLHESLSRSTLEQPARSGPS